MRNLREPKRVAAMRDMCVARPIQGRPAPAISHLRLCADLYTQYSTYVRRLVQTWTSEFRDPTNYSPDYHPWSAWAVQPGGLSALSSQTKAEPEAEGGR